MRTEELYLIQTAADKAVSVTNGIQEDAERKDLEYLKAAAKKAARCADELRILYAAAEDDAVCKGDLQKEDAVAHELFSKTMSTMIYGFEDMIKFYCAEFGFRYAAVVGASSEIFGSKGSPSAEEMVRSYKHACRKIDAIGEGSSVHIKGTASAKTRKS